MDEYTTITGEYKKQFINDVLTGMEHLLDNKQLSELNKSLYYNTANLDFADNPINHDLNYEKTNDILIEQYMKAKKTKGLSPRTLQTYNYTLKTFKKWVIKSFLEITSEDLKEFFIFYESQNNCSKTSLNNTRRNLSSFFRFLTDEDKILINPMLRIPAIKEPKKVKKAFTYEEIEKLRFYFNSKSRYKRSNDLREGGMRNLAIFELLLSSGIRIGELCSLKITDIDFNECKMTVTGKGNKQRIAYFSERAKLAIQNYLPLRKNESPYLFTQYISYKSKKKLTTIPIEVLIRTAGEKCNIEAHPHKFRRTFCTQMIKKGMPIDQVQSLMGHESIETTLRYIDLDDETVAMTHKKYTNF